MTPTFHYETSCRKCLMQFTQELKPVEPMSKHGFTLVMQDYLKLPPLLDCPNCDEKTIHDIISYKP